MCHSLCGIPGIQKIDMVFTCILKNKIHNHKKLLNYKGKLQQHLIHLTCSLDKSILYTLIIFCPYIKKDN